LIAPSLPLFYSFDDCGTGNFDSLPSSLTRPSAAHDAATQHLSKLPATTDTSSPLRPLTLV
jgi:hypothetical protein